MKDSKLKYRLVMDYIINEISNGTLKKGDKIYSENELVRKFSISRNTVREAIMRLGIEGYIRTQHGKGSFVCWEEKREKYIDGYSKTIAVIVAYMNTHIFPSIIFEIESQARQHGYQVTINCTNNHVLQERECLKEVLNSNIAAVIVEPTKSALPNPNLEYYQKLQENHIPVIFIHGYYPNLQSDYVIVDDVEAAYTATKYLISKGHSKIGGIFKSDDMQGHRRYQGMIKAICEHHCEVDENNIIWLSTQDEKVILHNAAAKKAVFERLAHCSASLCYNDDIAIAIADELMCCGIKIPDQHSLISFDNTRYGSAYRIPITSMDHPYGKIGTQAIGCVFEKLKNPEIACHKIMHVHLVEKNSVQDLTY